MFDVLTVKFDGRSYAFNSRDGDLDMNWEEPTDDTIKAAAAVGIRQRENARAQDEGRDAPDIEPNLTEMEVDRIESVIHIRPSATFA